MQKLNLVKAIIRYRPSATQPQKFVYGNLKKEDSARYLLLQKALDAYFPENVGKWEFCGGLIKKTETSEQAITREIKEETDLTFRVVKQLKTLESDKSTCDVYLIDASSMNLQLSSEHLDYRWVKAEGIKNMDLVLYADLLLEFFNNPEKYLI